MSQIMNYTKTDNNRKCVMTNFAKNVLGDNKKASKLNCFSELGE